MKTFRLISFEVLDNGQLKNIDLVDGLIINKEDAKNTWLIEVYTKPENLVFFEKAWQSQQEFLAHVVITHKDNNPVPFRTKVRSINKLDTNFSIILEGALKRFSKTNFAEMLLHDLLDKGLSGNELYGEFRKQLKNKTLFISMNNL